METVAWCDSAVALIRLAASAEISGDSPHALALFALEAHALLDKVRHNLIAAPTSPAGAARSAGSAPAAARIMLNRWTALAIVHLRSAMSTATTQLRAGNAAAARAAFCSAGLSNDFEGHVGPARAVYAASGAVQLAASQLPAPSAEQSLILDAVVGRGRNVIVDAVAGSGKTTTSLLLADAFRSRCMAAARHPPQESCAQCKLLLLTFSASLKSESRARINRTELSHVASAESFHSFAFRHYSSLVHDEGIKDAIDNALPFKPSRWTGAAAALPAVPRYAAIVLDETQDCNFLRYAFIVKLVRDLSPGAHAPSIVVLGDEQQAILEFLGADSRFLRFADDLIPSSRTWERHALSTSYRLTGNLAGYSNEVVNRLTSSADIQPRRRWIFPSPFKGDGPKVRYLVGDPYVNAKMLARTLSPDMLLHAEHYLILAPSFKALSAQTPLKIFADLLSDAGVQIYASQLADQKEGTQTKGKVLLSTFVSAKGLERIHVIVFNFDALYYLYYARGVSQLRCPDVLHVATTRASGSLTVVAERERGQHLPFLGLSALSKYADVCGNFQSPKLLVDESSPHTTEYTAHDFTDFGDELVFADLVKQLDSTTRGPGAHITIPSEIETPRGTYESTAEVNGLAVPAMIEFRTKRTCHMLEELKTLRDTSEPAMDEGLNAAQSAAFDRLVKLLPEDAAEQPPVEFFLMLSALYRASPAAFSPLSSFFTQLDFPGSFQWLHATHVDALTARLHELDGITDAKTKFEHFLYKDICVGERFIRIKGLIDVLTPTSLFEIKLTKTLAASHKLQLAIYAFLDLSEATAGPVNAEKPSPPTVPTLTLRPDTRPRVYEIFNVLTGERWRLNVVTQADADKLVAVVNELITMKLAKQTALSDDAFRALAERARDPLVKTDQLKREVRSALQSAEAAAGEARSAGGGAARAEEPADPPGDESPEGLAAKRRRT
jgi:hypothetical protein